MTSFTWLRPGEEFLEPFTVHQITFHHASCLVQGLGEEPSSLLLSIIVALSLVLALYIPFTPEKSSNIDAKPPFRYASACLRMITTTSAICTCYHTHQHLKSVNPPATIPSKPRNASVPLTENSFLLLSAPPQTITTRPAVATPHFAFKGSNRH